MAILLCPDCGKRYKLQGEPTGKVVRCPGCGAELERATDVPLRQRLKYELTRLSAVPVTEESDGAAGARIRVAERKARPIGQWILWGCVGLLLIGLAAGGWWAYASAHRPPLELPPEARAALAKAERADLPGREEQALMDWRTARGMIVLHRVREGQPEAFQDLVDRADERIRQLQATIRQHWAGLQPLQRAMNDAQAAYNAGRNREAQTMLEGLLEQIAKADIPQSDRKRLLSQAESLLTLARTAASQAPAASTGRPARTGTRTSATRTASTSRSGASRAAASPAATSSAAASTPAANELVLDGPTDALNWRVETWANPATLTLEPGSAVVIRQGAGTSDKWAFSMDRAVDLSSYTRLAFDIESDQPVRLSTALWTGPGQTMFETPIETSRGGRWRQVSFALGGRRFKCQATNWQFGAELENPESVARVTLLVYDRSQTPLRIRNVRLIP